LTFQAKFEPPARIITLEQNYRSTQPILAACNGVMRFARERFTKNLWSERKSKQKPLLTTVADETAQARYVVEQILEAREAGTMLKSQAVLFRASHHSAQLEIELGRRNIPFVKYGGRKFLEAAHVKDVISVLRWCENPADRVAGFRVVQLLPGIGPAIAERVQAEVEARRGRSDVLASIEVPKAAAEDWPGFAKLFARMRKAKAGWPAEFGLVRRWYEPQLQRIYDDAHLRMADIEHVQLFSATSARALLERSGLADVRVRGIRNRYPASYWTRLAPLPRVVKSRALGLLDGSRVGRVAVSLPVGNLVVTGVSRRGS